MTEDGHNQFCSVFGDCKLGEPPNETRKCTCGYRARKAQTKADFWRYARGTRPLGMSEANWLRTLGIKPGEDY